MTYTTHHRQLDAEGNVTQVVNVSIDCSHKEWKRIQEIMRTAVVTVVDRTQFTDVED